MKILLSYVPVLVDGVLGPVATLWHSKSSCLHVMSLGIMCVCNCLLCRGHSTLKSF